MNRKKIASVVLSIMMVGTVFTGCSKKVDSNKGTGDTADSNKLKPYTIQWFTIGTPQKDLQTVSDAASKYLKDKINASLQITQFDWGDYEQKMNVKINSGEKFDLAFTCSWALDYKKNAKRGAFVELNDLVDKYGKDMMKLINPAFIEGNKIDGKLYAIPVNKELGQQRVFRFNKKYVDKYNIDVTKYKTIQSLEPILKQVHEGSPEVIATYRPSNPSTELRNDSLIEGLPIVMDMEAKDNKFINIFTEQKMLDYLDTVRKYYVAGYVRKDDVAIEKSGNFDDENKPGKWFVDIAATQPYAEQLWSSSLGYPVVTNPLTEPITTNTSVSGSLIGISATAEDPDRDMMFLNLLNSDVALRNIINYGVEGTHYTKKSDNVIVQTQKGKDDYNVPAFSLGNVFLTYLLDGTPADKWDKFKEFNNSSISTPTLGFSFDQEPVKNEIAAIKNVMDEFNIPLYTGSVDPKDYVAKCNSKLKDAGIDKVITEAQKQFDDWKAKNK